MNGLLQFANGAVMWVPIIRDGTPIGETYRLCTPEGGITMFNLVDFVPQQDRIVYREWETDKPISIQ